MATCNFRCNDKINCAELLFTHVKSQLDMNIEYKNVTLRTINKRKIERYAGTYYV